MKKCRKCNRFRRDISFAKNKKRKDGLQSWCRECKKSNDRLYYLGHSEEMKIRIRKAKTKRMNALQDKIFQYLQIHPCIDCGEKDIIVLEFDHLRDKKYSVSDMIRRECKIERILEEINKCVVRCANCHRRRTTQQFGYRKGR